MHDPDLESGPDKAINPADIRFAAMNLLARREQSRQELHDKLMRRFPDENQVEAVIQRLSDENLQSDERYAQSYVRQRTVRGYGPRRIRQEMRERGLSDALIAAAFEEASPDWRELATQVYRKKFGLREADDLKEKSRRVRFMQYRGFSADSYQHLLSD